MDILVYLIIVEVSKTTSWLGLLCSRPGSVECISPPIQTVSVTTLLVSLAARCCAVPGANVRVVGLLTRVATATLIVHHASGL